MYTYDYPRPALTVDIAIFTIRANRLHILLIQRGAEPFEGCWALPGGFVGMDESLDDAAYRELHEETGLILHHLEQFHTYGAPDRDPRGRVVSVAYYALVAAEETQILRPGSDSAGAAWFSLDALPALAFDHALIITDALRHMHSDLDGREAAQMPEQL